MKKWILATLVAAAAFTTSCKKEDNDDQPNGDNTKLGNNVALGNGNARSFINNIKEHQKLELGLTIDAASLEGLPEHETNFLLDIPQEALQLTPFKHISLDWTPHGHLPQGVYDKPHFDVHFYMISRDEQQAITITNPALQKLPDTSLMPKLYLPEPTGIDKMGKHWIDLLSPELDPVHPSLFTSTMVYGSYDAEVIFIEPMITKDFLLTKPDTTAAIRQPDSVVVHSHYPTKYSISFDNTRNQYKIYLSGFEHR